MARIKHIFSERRNAYMQAAHMRRILRRHPKRLPELIPPTSKAGRRLNQPPMTEAKAVKKVVEGKITETVTAGRSGTMM